MIEETKKNIKSKFTQAKDILEKFIETLPFGTLTFDEAKIVTLSLGEFLYDLDLTKVTKERQDSRKVMEKPG
jgi:hypothetical protein